MKKSERADRKDMEALDLDIRQERLERLSKLRAVVIEAENEILKNGLGLTPESRLQGYLAALKAYATLFGMDPPKPDGGTVIYAENAQINNYAEMTEADRIEARVKALDEKARLLEQIEEEAGDDPKD